MSEMMQYLALADSFINSYRKNQEYPICDEYCELSSIEVVKSAGCSIWWLERSIFQIDFNTYLRKDTIKIANNENNNNKDVILDTRAEAPGDNAILQLTDGVIPDKELVEILKKNLRPDDVKDELLEKELNKAKFPKITHSSHLRNGLASFPSVLFCQEVVEVNDTSAPASCFAPNFAKKFLQEYKYPWKKFTASFKTADDSSHAALCITTDVMFREVSTSQTMRSKNINNGVVVIGPTALFPKYKYVLINYITNIL
uniref:Uncharacterized protein n=1 Tax=Glossina austeni TaxID=7395 RepID=A0A1A9VW63_GLOAU